MASEAPVPSSDNVDVVPEKPVPSHCCLSSGSESCPCCTRSTSRSKNKPGKVPRKIHKAEREKLKRDSLNDLFLKLSDTLEGPEPAHQNNGKASVLTNATRILRDLLAQVDCLKKENTTLLSESHYVAAEKHELKDENSALQAQIEDLKSEVQERIHSKYAWKLDHSQSQLETVPHLQEDHHLVIPVVEQASQPAPVLGSVLVVPLNHHDLTVYHEPDTSDSLSKLPTNVSRPHARYPSSSDSWPSQILAIPSDTTQIVQQASSSGEN